MLQHIMYLDFSGNLGKLLEHGLGLEAHLLRLQGDKGAHFPGVPGRLPVLRQLPDLLQVVEVLRQGDRWV